MNEQKEAIQHELNMLRCLPLMHLAADVSAFTIFFVIALTTAGANAFIGVVVASVLTFALGQVIVHPWYRGRRKAAMVKIKDIAAMDPVLKDSLVAITLNDSFYSNEARAALRFIEQS